MDAVSEIPNPEAVETTLRDITQRFGFDAARFQNNPLGHEYCHIEGGTRVSCSNVTTPPLLI